MIVKQTREQKIHAEITKLIDVLEPIAKKYKRISMAKDAMSAIGWSVYTSDSHGGATSVNMHLKHETLTEWVQVYEYGKKQDTLTDLVAMLKNQLPRYELSKPTVYTLKLCDFIDSALGAEVETTSDHFKTRKKLTVAALKRAIEYVNGLEDCKDTGVYQFDAPEKD